MLPGKLDRLLLGGTEEARESWGAEINMKAQVSPEGHFLRYGPFYLVKHAHITTAQQTPADRNKATLSASGTQSVSRTSSVAFRDSGQLPTDAWVPQNSMSFAHYVSDSWICREARRLDAGRISHML